MIILFVSVSVIIYGINAVTTIANTTKIKENQDYIIQALNESEETRQQNKIAILNNMTDTIVGNQKVIMDGQRNIQNNLTKILNNISHVMRDMDNETDLVANITIQLANKTNEMISNYSNENGSISGLGAPIIIQ